MPSTPDQGHVEKLILLSVSGLSPTDLKNAALAKIGVPADALEETMAEVHRRIILAGDASRAVERGKAVVRFEDIYRRALQGQDNRTALRAQAELVKLLRLDAPAETPAHTTDDESSLELAAVREHLEPLRLGPKGYPVSELARLAAAAIAAAKRR